MNDNVITDEKLLNIRENKFSSSTIGVRFISFDLLKPNMPNLRSDRMEYDPDINMEFPRSANVFAK